MNTPKGSQLSNIKNLICGIACVCSVALADSFFTSANAQTNSPKYSKEVNRDIEKHIGLSIYAAKEFPIHIIYPNTLLAKGYILWKTISFDPKKQALVMENTKGEKKFLCFKVQVPFTTAEGDVISGIVINAINYDHKTGKLAMNADCKRKSPNGFKEFFGKTFKGETANTDLPLRQKNICDIVANFLAGKTNYIQQLPLDDDSKAFATVNITVK